jgi:hypothetical protein
VVGKDPDGGREGVDRVGQDVERGPRLDSEDRLTDGFSCTSRRDERAEQDSVAAIDNDRHVPSIAACRFL